MELGFIAAAVRRYLLMVALCAVIGVVLGVVVVGSAKATYQSRSVILVRPPSNGNGTTFTGDPDRYVDAEISTMSSLSIQDLVVAELPRETTASVGEAIQFQQRDNSDVVDITATADSPQRSQAIANAYANAYLEYSNQLAEKASEPSPALNQLNADLLKLQGEIAALTNKIRSALPAGATDLSQSTDTVSAAQRDTALLEYQRLLESKTRLENNSQVTVNSAIVNLAGSPGVPTGGGSKLLLALGLVGGLGIGVSMALLRARFSSEVIDPAQVEELLGRPLAVRIPRVRGLGLDTTRLAVAPPNEIVEPLERLCVGVQSAATGDCVRVAVTATMRGIGASSLSTSMAGRFARRGSPTMLVDADQVDPWLSEVFGTVRGRGLIRLLNVPRDAGGKPEKGATVASMSIGTKLPELRVLGIGEVDVEHPLQRVDIPRMMALLGVPGTVSIIDAGPMLDNAASLEIARHVDALVVLLADARQQSWQLATIEQSLSDSNVVIFPVLAGARSKPRWRAWLQRLGAKRG
ncbi:MAG: hypothetical protein WCC60_01000 [Ilumatobacteraceae bacterium]